jgi:hypothetical protein
MNQAREGATATLLPNGKVLIAGGLGSTSTDIYDPRPTPSLRLRLT